MEATAYRAIAIVGVGAILPDAANVAEFWTNIKNGRYSISDVSADRWDSALYYDPDPAAPDKAYSKIGGWVRDYVWDPIKWHLPIPPRVVDAMDGAQKWGIACTREALEDYGYPKRPLNLDRTAVILGNAMAGEKHYLTSLRVYFPEYAKELAESAAFAALPQSERDEITRQFHDRLARHLPEITEDSMPGELANCIAGRIANIYNFHGPNYVVDAACASAMAAIKTAVEGLVQNDYDVAVTGGIDRNMGAPTFVKFCKIGALSATGTRPYAEGADGFVMGEGAAIFLLKRLADAERDGDKIYAVLRGIGGSSDGKGKGITAPNPLGQKICIERAWQNAGLSPATCTYIEGHGTSTRVGDVVEVQSMAEVLSSCHLAPGSVALGSVKSNIGHLKGAAGAAGLLKTVLALNDKVLPPSVHCEHPNPDIDFSHSPLRVNTELKSWVVAGDTPRRAGLSAFGFGGTNFHAVLEEYIPHRLTGNGKRSIAVPESPTQQKETIMNTSPRHPAAVSSSKAPLRGALVLGADSEAGLCERLRSVKKDADEGRVPVAAAPRDADLRAPERLVIDYADAAELSEKAGHALKAMRANQPAMWKVLRAQGIFRGQGAAPKVAFLYTGQGSQYVNMLKPLRAAEPIVAETFAEADRVMTPLLGKALSDFIFVDGDDERAVAKADEDLRQTAITQPAVLAIDLALTRLLAAYGIKPDFTMGHSLGEYGALVASGALPFADALEAVSARGRGMTSVAVKDNGRMAAVFAPLQEIERLLKNVNGYVVIANINSEHQAVIGGASQAVEQAMEMFQKAGYDTAALPVSHAFHTSIVAAASTPLREALSRLPLESPRIPIVANVNGDFYPMGPNVVPQMLDLLAAQVAAPVQFVKGLRTLYKAGARIFVEVGPKKALQVFAEDVLGANGDVISVFTNHPKLGDLPSFNLALCALYAAGLGRGTEQAQQKTAVTLPREVAVTPEPALPPPVAVAAAPPAARQTGVPLNGNRYEALGHMFADVLERGWQVYKGQSGSVKPQPVVITGAALGLPGTNRIFDDTNVARILRGDQFIDVIPGRLRQAMLDKNVIRLVKSENGGPTFETIQNVKDVIKLAGRGGAFDLEDEFGVSSERIAALDRVTQLAIACGIDALRDAGIPLVMRYKTTTKGTQLPDRWALPETLRDDTGVIFASAFPGLDSLADEMSRYYADHARHQQLASLESLRARAAESNPDSIVVQEIDRRLDELRSAIAKQPYVFERRFLFRTLSMGHSQFAEFIGARGPNTQVNAACASTTQAIALAEDWIRAGRCRRVVVVSADDVTSDNLMEWIGAGFLASGAAATDEVVEEAAIPFDRRRHGMIVGMGAAALVVESADAVHERGIQPICEVLGAVTANSAFHGTRLDVQHIGQLMEDLVSQVEARGAIERHAIAPHTVFVSHETYTPARGGSASAEIFALRRVFGESADKIVIANTKGFTGHPMGTGIEDVVAVKALETGCVPPVANFKEVDPELGELNLSKGGAYSVEYALRLAAGFGSQISMALLRWVRTKDGVRRSPNALGYTYRIADTTLWNDWLSLVGGYPSAELEVVHRTLRVRDRIAEARVANGAHNVEPAPAPIAVVKAPAASASQAEPLPIPIAEKKSAAEPIREIAPAKVSAQGAQPAPVEASKAASDNGSVKERVLALVADKTGYPVDMLDLDLDLEADLGVDTVKQAEVFASVREAYGIARGDQLKLRDFPTLAHVIRFVNDRRPDIAAKTPAPETTKTEEIKATVAARTIPAQATTAPTPDEVKQRILSLVVEKTGYPQDMLDLELDLEADLGVDTVKQAELFAGIREIYKIPRDENLKLRDFPTLAHVIRFVYDKRPDLKPAAAQSPKPVELAAVPAVAVKPASHDSTAIPAVPAANHDSTAIPAVAVKPASHDSIKDKILSIVAEKTGYPTDMLDLDLDLEADLGIDTVKQAEMFAAVRAAYNIPRDENLKLRDFPTLAHVIQFAQTRQPGAIQVTAPEPATTPASAPVQPAVSAIQQPAGPMSTPEFAPPTSTRGIIAPAAIASFDATNRIPRRVPLPVVRPDLSICKKTGVTLGPGCRVLLMPDQGGVADVLAEQLQVLGVEVLRLEGRPDAVELTERLKTWLAAGPVHGVYWLPALDYEGHLSEMNAATWHEAVRVRVKLLYTTMRALYEQIAAPGTFLIAATRLGGQHGYDEHGALAPLGGAVSGFVKTYKRERIDALVKAVDFEPERAKLELAELLIAETLRDPAAVEIGYKSGQRWTISLEEVGAEDGHPGMKLGKESVFLITGAAGSIVSAITADLAAASGGTFYLLDLVAEPDPHDPDLKRFATDKDALKRDLFERILARGERATPALVEKELATLERLQAAKSAIDAVRDAGGTAHYFSVNLTDANAVGAVVDQVRKRSGRIDVLLHAAGMERSHLLRDKDQREFDLIFDVKSDGWFNLLHAIGDMPLGVAVAFSSIAARFGNAGQTDYSSANDLLCKVISSFRTTRPATRGIAIDWTAWAGIGMASRGSIPKMMELAGIDMLPPEAGVPLIRRELTAGGTRGEIVIGERLGLLLNEWDPTGGLETSAVDDNNQQLLPALGPVAGKIASVGIHSGVVVETTLDPVVQPFLNDHRIEGTPLLPGVMGIEAFAEAAACVLPGWQIEAIEDVNFLAPFKFYRNEPRTFTVEAKISPQDECLRAECRLVGQRNLPNQKEPQMTTHFTGRVVLRKNSPPPSIATAIKIPGASSVKAEDIYRLYFHGPAYQVLKQAWWDGHRVIGEFAHLPANHHPDHLPTLTAPRLIELCFQTAGLWEMGVQGRFGLPRHIDRVRVLRAMEVGEEPVYAVVTPDAKQGSFNAEVIDAKGNAYLVLTAYRTIALPTAMDTELLKPLQAAMSVRATVA